VSNVASSSLNLPDLYTQTDGLNFDAVDRFLKLQHLAPHGSWRVEAASSFPNLKPSLSSSPSAPSNHSLLTNPQSDDYAVRLELSKYDWGTTHPLTSDEPLPPLPKSARKFHSTSPPSPLTSSPSEPLKSPAPSSSLKIPASPTTSLSKGSVDEVTHTTESGSLSLQSIGDALLPLVRKHQPDIATQIINILLEMELHELNQLLTTPELLIPVINETTKLLKGRASLGVRSLASTFIPSRGDPDTGSSPPSGTSVSWGVHNDDQKKY
jgi:hypothetical protein